MMLFALQMFSCCLGGGPPPRTGPSASSNGDAATKVALQDEAAPGPVSAQDAVPAMGLHARASNMSTGRHSATREADRRASIASRAPDAAEANNGQDNVMLMVALLQELLSMTTEKAQVGGAAAVRAVQGMPTIWHATQRAWPSVLLRSPQPSLVFVWIMACTTARSPRMCRRA